jgi:methyl-accepting chemotaxis protein
MNKQIQNKDKKTTSTFKKMFLLMISFGLLMGIIFPWYADFFVVWIDDLKIWFILGCLVAGALVGISNYFIVKYTIQKTLINLMNALEELADRESDLTLRLDVLTRDEIGNIARFFNTFVAKLQKVIHAISGNITVVTSSSSNLSNFSKQMHSGAAAMRVKSETVSSSVEKLSSNMTSVAAAMEQNSSSTTQLASAIEQIAFSVSEIAKSSEQSRLITEQAVVTAKTTSERVHELGISAKEITAITNTINEISEQTNLLALNATIEAARAGEAGKGFAVVANEIKDLATQTAKATQEIKNKITAIQNETKCTVEEILGISKTIDNVNDVVNTIAAAVEEQATTTKEIAYSVSQVAAGIDDVAEMICGSSDFSNKIFKEIEEVAQISVEMSEMSFNLKRDAEEMSDFADHLKHTIEVFRT